MNCVNHPHYEASARCILCGSLICDYCHTRVGGEDYCKKCVTQKSSTGHGKPVAPEKRIPALAAVLSFVIAGSGQVYNGQVGKGVLIFLTAWLIVPWIYGIFDAYQTAKKINEGIIETKSATGCLIAMVVLVMLLPVVAGVMGLLAAIAIPNFVRARSTATTNMCIANMKAIESAKNMWAIDSAGETGSQPEWSDLVPDYLYSKPICSLGGKYSINNMRTPPSCSVGDMGTEIQDDDHILR